MEKSCKECIHSEVCGIYQLTLKGDDSCANDCKKYMCMRMAWEWLNELREKAKGVNDEIRYPV